MNERVRFISLYLEEEDSFTDLCEEFGISRKTGYKWVRRYEEGGPEGLRDRTSAPKSHPNAVAQEVVRKILAVRQKHPRWGPKKIVAYLLRRYPRSYFPATSTVGEILKRNGMIGKPKRKRRCSPYKDKLREYRRPNEVWCADFKGHFTVSGQRCCPLTITDGFSRYLIACKALKSSCHAPAKRVFEAAFREYGLPEVIRTDNGAPFATLAPGGLSRLSIWWIRMGIRPERIMPGRPDQNGRHERMHRTLKAETAKPPRSTFRTQQRAFDKFRQEYNEIRPHEALTMDVPSTFYKRSVRPYPSRLPELVYPGHYHVRKVYPNGVFSFAGVQWLTAYTLAGQCIGLEPIDEDRWKVYFADIALGEIDLREYTRRQFRNFGRLARTEQGSRWGWHGNTGKAYHRKRPYRKR